MVSRWVIVKWGNRWRVVLEYGHLPRALSESKQSSGSTARVKLSSTTLKAYGWFFHLQTHGLAVMPDDTLALLMLHLGTCHFLITDSLMTGGESPVSSLSNVNQANIWWRRKVSSLIPDIISFRFWTVWSKGGKKMDLGGFQTICYWRKLTLCRNHWIVLYGMTLCL
jgi:hypothetical protein